MPSLPPLDNASLVAKLCGVIVHYRRLFCPRTSYATSGDAARQLVVLTAGAARAADGLLGDLRQIEVNDQLRSEFQQFVFVEEDLTSVKLHGHVVLVNSDCSVELLKSLIKALREKIVKLLIFIDYEYAAPFGDSNNTVNYIFEANYALANESNLESGDDVVVHSDSLAVGGFKVHVMHLNQSAQSAVLSGNRSVEQHDTNPNISYDVSCYGDGIKSFNGQPSVSSKRQFGFLWNIPRESDVDRCRQRVVVRLNNRKPEGGDPSTSIDWDQTISTLLGQGKDDYDIYDYIRKIYCGNSLFDKALSFEDNSSPSSTAVLPVDSSLSQNKSESLSGIDVNDSTIAEGSSVIVDIEKAKGAEVEAKEADDVDGRALFLVKEIISIIPPEYSNCDNGRSLTVLDYGCAEGAITATLGSQLGIEQSRLFGADVRVIPANGFTFIHLPSEIDESRDRSIVGSDGSDIKGGASNSDSSQRNLMPCFEHGSVDIINASMVFHHVTNIEKTLLELRRIIKPSGILILREHHCDSREMAAFLDITHGLYSLSWSNPVEWPSFIDEYRAYYRSQEQWNELLFKCGFIRQQPWNYNAKRAYDRGSMAVRGDDIKNVIRAYHAAYIPDSTFDYSKGARSGGPVHRPVQSAHNSSHRGHFNANSSKDTYRTNNRPQSDNYSHSNYKNDSYSNNSYNPNNRFNSSYQKPQYDNRSSNSNNNYYNNRNNNSNNGTNRNHNNIINGSNSYTQSRDDRNSVSMERGNSNQYYNRDHHGDIGHKRSNSNSSGDGLEWSTESKCMIDAFDLIADEGIASNTTEKKAVNRDGWGAGRKRAAVNIDSSTEAKSGSAPPPPPPLPPSFK